jgi:hypothetical protein
LDSDAGGKSQIGEINASKLAAAWPSVGFDASRFCRSKEEALDADASGKGQDGEDDAQELAEPPNSGLIQRRQSPRVVQLPLRADHEGSQSTSELLLICCLQISFSVSPPAVFRSDRAFDKEKHEAYQKHRTNKLSHKFGTSVLSPLALLSQPVSDVTPPYGLQASHGWCGGEEMANHT